MAVKKSKDEEQRREVDESPLIRRPFDDEVKDPVSEVTDVELRNPWENPGDVPVAPVPEDDDKKPKPPKKDK